MTAPHELTRSTPVLLPSRPVRQSFTQNHRWERAIDQITARSVRIALALVGLGVAFAVVSGLPLTYDGAGYLFSALDNQYPFILHDRLINYFLQLPVILTSRITGDLTTLRWLFSATYAVLPLLALGLSWLVIRECRPALFVWPALGIGLATLPGQVFFVSEAIFSVQLFWPILLAGLAGTTRRFFPLIVLLAAFLFVAHPTSAALFAIVAFAALVVSGRSGLQRACFYFSLALLSLSRFVVFGTPYERESISLETLGRSFDLALRGSSLVVTGLGLLLALLTMGIPLLAGRSGHRWRLGLVVVIGLVAVTVMANWASDTAAWKSADNFHYWAPIVSLPYFAFAVLDRLRPPADPLQERLSVSIVPTAIFAVTMAIQGASWAAVTDRLAHDLVRSQYTCVPLSALAWIRQTPLDTWSTTMYSALIQDRETLRLALPPGDCADTVFVDGIPTNPSTEFRRRQGWFDMQLLVRRLTAEQERPHGCRLLLSGGWFPIETTANGHFWWAWSSGVGILTVQSDRGGQVRLDALMETATVPNTVAILVNGTRQATVNLREVGSRPIPTQQITITPGRSTIELIGNQPPQRRGSDQLLTLLVSNARLTFTDGLSCSIDGTDLVSR